VDATITIGRPVSVADLDDVRALMRAFVAWHREWHVEDRELIDGYFDSKALEEELAGLPGAYSPTEGDLLLARCDGEAAGCVALRRLDDRACEMKRMFLYPRFHGRGIGLALGEAIVREARRAGYAVMRLDTSVRQTEARSLYYKLGFREIEAYYDLPPAIRDWLVFMELDL
jgi:GNAT superfamily N-acetyltransferase